MKSRTKERVYLVVTVFCLLMCAVLLLSVILDRPVFSQTEAVHVPALRPLTDVETGTEVGAAETGAPTGMVVTEKDLQGRLAACLPASFPAGTVGVDIGKDGTVELSMKVGRTELREWLESSGAALTFRQRLALRLLPKALSVQLCMNAVGEDDSLSLTPRSLQLEDEEIDLSGLPSGVFSVLGGAVNAALKAIGYSFSSVTFTDEALVLQ